MPQTRRTRGVERTPQAEWRPPAVTANPRVRYAERRSVRRVKSAAIRAAARARRPADAARRLFAACNSCRRASRADRTRVTWENVVVTRAAGSAPGRVSAATKGRVTIRSRSRRATPAACKRATSGSSVVMRAAGSARRRVSRVHKQPATEPNAGRITRAQRRSARRDLPRMPGGGAPASTPGARSTAGRYSHPAFTIATASRSKVPSTSARSSMRT